MRIKLCYVVALLCVAVPLGAEASAAAAALANQGATPRVDPRWTAWLGCWQQLEETVKDQNVIDPAKLDGPVTKGVVVCVTPGESAEAVRLSTIIEKQAALEDTIVADGASRIVDESGCSGSQIARWSENGRRLFARAELSCADGTKREISGLATIAPGPVWVDIQVVTTNRRETIRVRRYRRSADHAYAKLTREQLAEAASAAQRQATTFTMNEVKEATSQVAPSTLEAALIETNAGFPLNAKRLKELDAAGVPDRVLDLMIALSFPNRFVVERRTVASSGGGFGGIDDLGWMLGGYDGFDMFAYDMFPYRYRPFGYGMWGGGYYDQYYYIAPPVTVAPGPQPSGEGRVVDGFGYTRVRSRDPQPVGGAGGYADGSGTSSTGGNSGSSGGVSSQGYSGGGGDGGGRTAVARPPG
jgi:uncharacterized membrane protein YgcG